MIKVETKTGYILFTNHEDAENYKDYLENGLKVVKNHVEDGFLMMGADYLMQV